MPLRKSGPALQPTVFFFCRLGDMIMLTRLLNLLHQRYGQPCQVVGVGSWTRGVFAGSADVADVWSFHRHLPFVLERGWRQVRRALRASHPGPIYICERHYRQLPRIRRMLRFSGVDPRRCVFLTDQPVTGPEHLVDRLVNLGTQTPALLADTDYPVPPAAAVVGPRLHVEPAERAALEAWLATRGWTGRPLILVQPGNHRSMGPRRKRWRRLNTDNKWWPLERWAELLHRIHAHEREALIILRGSPEELPMLEEVRAAAALDYVVTDGHWLGRLFALTAAAHSVISVDTGPAHAAAALGVPLVVLFGAENPAHWLPRTPNGTPFGTAPVVGVGGAPSRSRADQVPADEVFQAWLSVLNTCRPAPAAEAAAATAAAAGPDGATVTGSESASAAGAHGATAPAAAAAIDATASGNPAREIAPLLASSGTTPANAELLRIAAQR